MLKAFKLTASGAAVIVALGTLTPAYAAAQGAAQIDPSQDSPAGTVYRLPLDKARQDAAPRSPEGGLTGGGRGAEKASPSEPGGTSTTSAIHSENGYGSSSRVPGLGSATGSASPHGTGRKAAATASGEAPASSPGMALTAGPSDPSGARVYGLLALGVLLAVAVSLAGRRATRRRRG